MSYNFTDSVSANLFKTLNAGLRGGRIVESHSLMSPTDPASSGFKYALQCLKHPDYRRTFYSTLMCYDLVEKFQEDAQRLINECPYCAEIETQRKTRFPEGAEL